MDRIKLKPLKPILLLTYPKAACEKSETNYRESTTVTKLIRPRVEWDKARDSVALNLFHAHQDLSVAEDELREVKAKAKVAFKECDDRWKMLEEKQHNFRKNFLKFEWFVRGNQEKRDRAHKKLQNEHQLGIKYDEMGVNLRERYEVLLKVKTRIEENCKLYRKYDDFLTKVLHHEPTLKDIQGVMQKHLNLMEIKNEILEKRNQLYDGIDAMKAKHISMNETHMLNLLSKNSKIVDLTCRHETARHKALMWEGVVAKIRAHSEMTVAELDSVKMGVWELYKMMCHRRMQPARLKEEDFEEQVMFVRKSLLTLKKINKVLAQQKRHESVKVTDSFKRVSSQRVVLPKRRK